MRLDVGDALLQLRLELRYRRCGLAGLARSERRRGRAVVEVLEVRVVKVRLVRRVVLARRRRRVVRVGPLVIVVPIVIRGPLVRVGRRGRLGLALQQRRRLDLGDRSRLIRVVLVVAAAPSAPPEYFKPAEKRTRASLAFLRASLLAALTAESLAFFLAAFFCALVRGSCYGRERSE